METRRVETASVRRLDAQHDSATACGHAHPLFVFDYSSCNVDPANLAIQKTQHCTDMESAVRWLAGQARPGDCVLLSPACASLDMYRNYADRAQAFVVAVKGLPS